MQEWITNEQVKELLQVKSRTTVWEFSIKYNIRVSKPSGRVYYNRADILKAIEDNAVRMGI
jgi:hypothetical protein